MREIIRFQSLYQERVWGGRALASSLGRNLPSEKLIGEAWELVDRPEAQSIVKGGSLNGMRLRSRLEKYGVEIMGPKYPASKPFPVLVKWLDCRERLSLQVHPPASVAPELGGEPKTENWYIAETSPGASLIVGLKHGVTRDMFEKAMANNTLESCVHRFPVKEGDSIFVESGRLHAIDAGNLILEIQQNSDTTYRVYDWGRVGLDGKPRQMHVRESLKSIKWDDFEPTPRSGAVSSRVLAECKEFSIRRVVLAKGEKLSLAANEQPRILSVVSGSLVHHGGGAPELVSRGENVLLPYCAGFEFEALDGGVVLLTENFNH